MSLMVAPGVRWIEVDDGCVIFAAESSRYVDLNEAGALMWKLLTTNDCDSTSVVDRLVDDVGLTVAQADSAIETLAAQLVELEVLRSR